MVNIFLTRRMKMKTFDELWQKHNWYNSPAFPLIPIMVKMDSGPQCQKDKTYYWVRWTWFMVYTGKYSWGLGKGFNKSYYIDTPLFRFILDYKK